MTTEKKTATLTDEERAATIARLAESKRLRNEEAEQAGFELGRNWARDVAEHRELQRLDRWEDSSDESLEIVWERDESGVWELCQILFPDCTHVDLDEFLETAFAGDEDLGPGDVRGFIRGDRRLAGSDAVGLVRTVPIVSAAW